MRPLQREQFNFIITFNPTPTLLSSFTLPAALSLSYLQYNLNNPMDNLSPTKHNLRTDSEVTIFKMGNSLANPTNDVDTLLQEKYNTEQRKLIIVNRSKGRIIDSRYTNIDKQLQDSLKQSYFKPVVNPMKHLHPDQEYTYEKISDLPYLCTFVDQKKDSPNGKSIWQSNYKEYDRLHEHFLQSILKDQSQIFFAHLNNKTSHLPIDINYRFQSNWAVIHYAAMHYRPAITRRIIADKQVDVNALTDFNETALHIAAKSDQLENCQLLIEAGVCIDKRDSDQNTALHYASEFGYRNIICLLLEKGASCIIPNCTGMTAFDLALPQLAELFEKYRLKGEEGDEKEENALRNRANHRNMIEKILEKQGKSNEDASSPNINSPKKRLSVEDHFIEGGNERRVKREAQFWRKKNIFKLYQFVQSNQKIETVTLSSFIFYKKIGEGAFGQVYLVKRDNDDDKLYALKAIKKERVYGTSLYRYIQTEREILSLVDHPFVVRLRYAMQTETYLFLVMDYCEGGDLSKLLQKRRRFTEQQVKNYACQILLGVQALHRYNIIYRDLKPDNIVLDKDGHALLTDFGLSKKTDDLDSLNKSFCGTPAYLPLQIINKRGHNRMVDWYQFGIVLYQLYVGCPPYNADTKRQLYDIVRKGIVRFSKNTPEKFKDLIKRLLAQNPQKRLGFEQDAESIRAHPWFQGVDWNEVIEKRLMMTQVQVKVDYDQPIITKFHDVKSEKFKIPMWSFMQ